MRQDKLTRAVSGGPALLLLLLVTSGLFTMHTLGHAGPHDPSMHSHAWALAPWSAHTQPDMTAERRGQTQAGDQAPDKPLPFGSLAVCMAVLATLVLLAVAVLLTGRAAGWIARLHRLLRRRTDMVRGPPALPIGLLIADLSVACN
jgi:hypothetical protein